MPFCRDNGEKALQQSFQCDHCLQTCPFVKISKCFRVKWAKEAGKCQLAKVLSHCRKCQAACNRQKGPTRGRADAPRPEDVWITSYPKTGSTWVRHLVTNLLRAVAGRKEKGPATFGDVDDLIPFLEDSTAWRKKGEQT